MYTLCYVSQNKKWIGSIAGKAGQNIKWKIKWLGLPMRLLSAWRYTLYRVIHKSLWDFWPLRYSSRDGHAEEEHVNRGRESLPSFFCVLGAVAYLQVSQLGGSHDETWRGQGIRKRCVFELAKTESIVTVQRRFRTTYHTEPPTDKTIH
jgi:hypothetical protein